MKLTLDQLAKFLLPRVKVGEFFSLREKRTLIAAAEVVLEGCPVHISPFEVVKNIEDFLVFAKSRRAWRIRLLATLLEFAPLIFLGRGRFSHLSFESRKKLIQDKFVHGKNVWLICSKVKQLVYLGVYNDPRSNEIIGFVPWQERSRYKKISNRSRVPLSKQPASEEVFL